MSFPTGSLCERNSLILAGKNHIKSGKKKKNAKLNLYRDWGPAFLPVGVWQPAYVAQLDGLGSVYVSNSDFDIYRKGQLNNLPPPQNTDWVFNASIDVVGTVPEDAIMSCQIFDMDSNEQISSDNLSNIHNIGNTITGIATLDASKYELWWPNGLGAQKLYNIRVEIVSDGKTIATVEKRMGFRTIVLNMEPISQEQLSQGIINGSNCRFFSENSVRNHSMANIFRAFRGERT